MQNHAPHTPRLPVLCDSCLAEGAAGEEPFTDLDGLLDFKPVPRQTGRLDAWTPEVQRAFIVALVACGSYNAAALAVGKASNGAAQLRKHEEGAGFLEACKRARAIYRERGGRRRAASVRALAAQDAAWAPHPAPWANAASRRPALPPPQPEPEPDEEERIEDAEQWLFGIARKYMAKLGHERSARLAGEVVAADFYLRQLTFIEVAMDLMGTGGFDLLHAFRRDGHTLIDIAETPFSRILDEARRIKWAELGEPIRPRHPPDDWLEHHDGYSTAARTIERRQAAQHRGAKAALRGKVQAGRRRPASLGRGGAPRL